MVTNPESQACDHRGVDALGGGAAILWHGLAQEVHRGKIRGAEAHGVRALQQKRQERSPGEKDEDGAASCLKSGRPPYPALKRWRRRMARIGPENFLQDTSET
jgi:hypothetical protein